MSISNKNHNILSKSTHHDANEQTPKTACIENPKWSISCFFISMFLVTLLTDSGFAKTFTTSDFEGTWNLHGLGIVGNSGAWGYGTLTFNDMGHFTGSYISSTGHSESPSGTLSINEHGVIKALDFGGLTSTFHGVMNNNKDIMVSTGTGGDGSYQLHLFVKTRGTFNQSDLQGKWIYHGLAAGDRPSNLPGWYYGSITMDADGNATYSQIVDSEGNNDYVPHPAIFNISEDGLVTISGMSSFRGVMDQSKDMIVAVATTAPGRSSSVRGYNLLIIVKQNARAYTISDLAGTWYVNALVSGSYNDWTGWYYLTWVVDRQGKGNMFAGSHLNSSGETEQPSSGTMSITSDGIITFSNLPTCHGIINLGKNMWVGTMDDGGGGYGLAISIGRPADDLDAADFDMDGDVDFADFAVFAEHWLN